MVHLTGSEEKIPSETPKGFPSVVTPIDTAGECPDTLTKYNKFLNLINIRIHPSDIITHQKLKWWTERMGRGTEIE